MSLQSRLAALITAIGADVKALQTQDADQYLPGILLSEAGFLDANQDLHAIQGSSTPTLGTLYMMRFTNRKQTSITVSAATMLVAVAGAGLTNVGFALYSSAGALLTSSVNANGATAAAFQGVNPKTVTFTPQVIAAGAQYYVAFWFTGTTAPQLYRSLGTNFAINLGSSAPTYRYATANTGLTNTAPSTIGTQSMMPWAMYCAVA